MYYCLNKYELIILLNHLISGTEIKEDQLQQLIMDSQNWTCLIGVLNYTFCMVLEQNRKQQGNRSEKIHTLYNATDEMLLEIHEIDKPFINHMLNNLPQRSLSIEENLIDIQNDIGNYNYGNKVRY